MRSSPAQESETMDLEPALALMRQATLNNDLAELRRLLRLPKRLPPWAHSESFPANGGARCLRDLETCREHPLCAAIGRGNLEAIDLLLGHASPWVKANSLEAAASIASTTAFDRILDAIEMPPTPERGWPLVATPAGTHYGSTPEELIAIYPFGSALTISVAAGFTHGVRQLIQRVVGDAWTEADRLLSYRTISIGVERLPISFDAVAALLPALPIKRALVDLKIAQLEQRQDRNLGEPVTQEMEDLTAALRAMAEGLAIQRELAPAAASTSARAPRI